MLHKGLMKQAQKVLQPTVFKLGQLKAAERQVISSFIDKNNIDPIKGAVRLRQVFSKEDLKALRRKALEMGSVSLFWSYVLLRYSFWFRVLIVLSLAGIVYVVHDWFFYEKDALAKKDGTVRFGDVRGMEDYRQEIEELAEMIRNSEKFEEKGIKFPRGILLEGPPGVGKTLLARALANETDANFYFLNAGSLSSDSGSNLLKKTFKKAAQSQPSIIFIDEFDSIAFNRNGQTGSPMILMGGRTGIHELLALMDGFKGRGKVFVIATTNFINLIDPAALRPGRFDKVIRIPLPAKSARKDILSYYLDKVPNKRILNIDRLVNRTQGMAGADIANVVNLAVMNATRRGSHVEDEDIDQSVERVRIGIVRTSVRQTPEELLLTAYHEAGHALVKAITSGVKELDTLTILPKGGSLGHTSYHPPEHNFRTREDLLSMLDTAFGGRVAEEIFYDLDHVTSGCGSDMQQAARIAGLMVNSFGMGSFLSVAPDKRTEKASQLLEFDREEDVSKLLDESYARTKKLFDVPRNKAALKQLALKLIELETIKGSELQNLISELLSVQTS